MNFLMRRKSPFWALSCVAGSLLFLYTLRKLVFITKTDMFWVPSLYAVSAIVAVIVALIVTMLWWLHRQNNRATQVPPHHCTVVVVGGGPGGCITAMGLARAGIDVCVLEQHTGPRHKIGESLLYSIMQVADLFGFIGELNATIGQCKPGGIFRLRRDDTTEQIFLFPRPARQVKRQLFDAMLRRHAVSIGSRLCEGIRVVSVCEQERIVHWSCALNQSSGKTSFEYLVDASGVASLLSSKGCQTRDDTVLTRTPTANGLLDNVALYGYFSVPISAYTGRVFDDEQLHRISLGSIIVEGLPDGIGWAWAIPLGGGKVSVGVVVPRRALQNLRISHGGRLSSVYHALVDACPLIQRMIRPSGLGTANRWDGRVHVAKDASFAASVYAWDRMRLVGDAAQFLDPLFSSGVHMAIVGGLSAAASIAAELHGTVSTEDAIAYHNGLLRRQYTILMVAVAACYEALNGSGNAMLKAFTTTYELQSIFKSVGPAICSIIQKCSKDSFDSAELDWTEALLLLVGDAIDKRCERRVTVRLANDAASAEIASRLPEGRRISHLALYEPIYLFESLASVPINGLVMTGLLKDRGNKYSQLGLRPTVQHDSDRVPYTSWNVIPETKPEPGLTSNEILVPRPLLGIIRTVHNKTSTLAAAFRAGEPIVVGASERGKFSIHMDAATLLAVAHAEPNIAVLRWDNPSVTRAYLNQSVTTLHSQLSASSDVYGVTTGFGGNADISSTNWEAVQLGLIKHLNAGFCGSEADLLPDTIVRAAMLLRIVTICQGRSAARFEVVDALMRLINAHITPLVPLRGSISASGDLMPLSYVAGLLAAREGVYARDRDGRKMEAVEALRIADIKRPIVFKAKEALAIVNGTSVSCAMAASVLLDAQLLSLLVQVLTAMSVEALIGYSDQFDHFVHEARPHPGQLEIAANIRYLLEGSALVQENCVPAACTNRKAVHMLYRRRLCQDRYSLRTAPQWLSPFVEQLLHAHGTLDIEINSSSDNPLVDAARGIVLNGGNFQASNVAHAMEYIRIGIHSAAKLVFAQHSELMNSATNMGLPPNLAYGIPGVDFGHKGVDVSMAAYMAELGHATSLVMPHAQSAELHNQSINSMALVASRATANAVHLLQLLCACHLYSLTQALDLRLFESMVYSRICGVVETLCVDTTCRAAVLSAVCDSLSSNHHIRIDKRCERAAASAFCVMLSSIDKETIASDILFERAQLASGLQNAIHIAHSDFDAFLRKNDGRHPLLGRGSDCMYRWVRVELGVPFFKDDVDHNHGTQLEIIVAALQDSRKISSLLVNDCLPSDTPSMPFSYFKDGNEHLYELNNDSSISVTPQAETSCKKVATSSHAEPEPDKHKNELDGTCTTGMSPDKNNSVTSKSGTVTEGTMHMKNVAKQDEDNTTNISVAPKSEFISIAHLLASRSASLESAFNDLVVVPGAQLEGTSVGERRLSVRLFDGMAAHTAAQLGTELGNHERNLVLCMLVSSASVAAMCLTMACWYRGWTAAPLSIGTKASHLAQQIRAVEGNVLVIASNILNDKVALTVKEIVATCPVKVMIVHDATEPRCARDAFAALGEALSDPPAEIDIPVLDEKQVSPTPFSSIKVLSANCPACWLFSSASSNPDAVPNATCLSHGAILANCRARELLWLSAPLNYQDRVLTWLPFSHVMGFIVDFVNNGIFSGATLVLRPSRDKPAVAELLARDILQTRPSIFYTVPWLVDEIALLLPQNMKLLKALQSMRAIVSGGAPLSLNTSIVLAEHKVCIVEAYGTTEAGGTVLSALLPPQRGEHDAGTIGESCDVSTCHWMRSLPGLHIDIVDQSLRSEQRGMIKISGKAYAETERTFLDSLTGTKKKSMDTLVIKDIFEWRHASNCCDDEREFRFVCRADDLVALPTGHFISALSIESALAAVPNIKTAAIVHSPHFGLQILIELTNFKFSDSEIDVDTLWKSIRSLVKPLPVTKSALRIVNRPLPLNRKKTLARAFLQENLGKWLVSNSSEKLVAELNTFDKQTSPNGTDMFSLVTDNLVAVVGCDHSTLSVTKDTPLSDVGLDSLLSLQLLDALGQQTGHSRLPATILFSAETVGDVAMNLAVHCKQADQGNSTGTFRRSKGCIPHIHASDEDVVVVGMGCLLPGGINSHVDLFKSLDTAKGGEQLVFPHLVPKDRHGLSGETTARANFLESAIADGFDSKLFGILPAEAACIDPQQRLMLETTWTAFEDAGLSPRGQHVRDARIGVFAAAAERGHITSLKNATGGEPPRFAATGADMSACAGRIAHTFRLQGPVMTVTTACSSAAVAIDAASEALRRGRCSMAVVSAAHVISDSFTFDVLRAAGVLSPSYRCAAFTAKADGYVPAEGVATILLCSRAYARSIQLYIYGTISSAIDHNGGKSLGIAAPSTEAQERVMLAALDAAGCLSHHVQCVEAHATGTISGDTSEAAALASVFKDRPDQVEPLVISATKATLGHTEAASALIALIKVLASMKAGRYLATPVHGNRLHPDVVSAFKMIPACISTQKEWLADDNGYRTAMVLSAGITGTVGALVVRSKAEVDSSLPMQLLPRIFVATAATEEALHHRLLDCASLLESKGSVSANEVIALCDTSVSVRVDYLPFRAAVVASSANVRDFASILRQRRTSAQSVTNEGTKIVFLFGGQRKIPYQVSQAMVALYKRFHIFRETVDEAIAEVSSNACRTALETSFYRSCESTCDSNVYVQVVYVVLQLAIVRMWAALGISPAIVLGYSLGEFSAAVTAGSFTFAEAVRLVEKRAQVFDEAGVRSPDDSMRAVFASEEQICKAIEDCNLGELVDIAAVNGRTHVVVSGDRNALMAVASHLGVKSISLDDVAFSFHSRRIEAAAAEFGAAADSLIGTSSTLAIPLASTTTGDVLERGTRLAPGHWYRNARKRVLFMSALDALTSKLSNERIIFVDCGTGDLLSMVQRHIVGDSSGTVTLPHIERGAAFLYTATKLPMPLDMFFDHTQRRTAKSCLWPPYSFTRKSARLIVKCASPLAERRIISHVMGPPNEMVAIVGVGLRMPGDITSLDDLGRVLSVGTAVHISLPEDRPPVLFSERVRHLKAAYMKDGMAFDTRFFGVEQHRAWNTDPQCWQLCEAVYNALEHANLPPSTLAGSRTGVYVSASESFHVPCLVRAGLLRPNVKEFAFSAVSSTDTGNHAHSAQVSAAALISHMFGFCGPIANISGFCESSVQCIQTAMNSLRSGNCDIAIVCGSSFFSNEIALESAAPWLTNKPGHPFSCGNCPVAAGEAAAVLVLQLASTAHANGNKVFGCIPHAQVASTGAKVPQKQQPRSTMGDVLEEVLSASRLTAGDISLVEMDTNGPGCHYSAEEELAGLHQALKNDHRMGTLYLRSTSACTGKTFQACAMVSIASILAQLQNEVIYKSPCQLDDLGGIAPHFTTALAFDGFEFAPCDRNLKWERNTKGQRAALVNVRSAAGAAGVVAVTEDDYTLSSVKTSDPMGPHPDALVFAVSAKSIIALQKLVSAYRKMLGGGNFLNAREEMAFAAAVCSTATACRNLYMPYRFSVVATSSSNLIDRLEVSETEEIHDATSNTIIIVVDEVIAEDIPKLAAMSGMEYESSNDEAAVGSVAALLLALGIQVTAVIASDPTRSQPKSLIERGTPVVCVLSDKELVDPDGYIAALVDEANNDALVSTVLIAEKCVAPLINNKGECFEVSQNNWHSLLVENLFQHGKHEVSVAAIASAAHGGRQPRVQLPLYPFDRTSLFGAADDLVQTTKKGRSGADTVELWRTRVLDGLHAARVKKNNNGTSLAWTIDSRNAYNWLNQHRVRVSGGIIVPGAAWADAALATAAVTMPRADAIAVSVIFDRPLFVNTMPIIHVELMRLPGPDNGYPGSSLFQVAVAGKVHGYVGVQTQPLIATSARHSNRLNPKDLVEMQASSDRLLDEQQVSTWYESGQSTFNYGEAFRCVRRIWKLPNNSILSLLDQGINSDEARAWFVVPPPFLDACLHAGAICGENETGGAVPIALLDVRREVSRGHTFPSRVFCYHERIAHSQAQAACRSFSELVHSEDICYRILVYSQRTLELIFSIGAFVVRPSATGPAALDMNRKAEAGIKLKSSLSPSLSSSSSSSLSSSSSSMSFRSWPITVPLTCPIWRPFSVDSYNEWGLAKTTSSRLPTLWLAIVDTSGNRRTADVVNTKLLSLLLDHCPNDTIEFAHTVEMVDWQAVHHKAGGRPCRLGVILLTAAGDWEHDRENHVAETDKFVWWHESGSRRLLSLAKMLTTSGALQERRQTGYITRDSIQLFALLGGCTEPSGAITGLSRNLSTELGWNAVVAAFPFFNDPVRLNFGMLLDALWYEENGFQLFRYDEHKVCWMKQQYERFSPPSLSRSMIQHSLRDACVLITGGFGCVGRAVIRLLLGDCSVSYVIVIGRRDVDDPKVLLDTKDFDVRRVRYISTDASCVTNLCSELSKLSVPRVTHVLLASGVLRDALFINITDHQLEEVGLSKILVARNVLHALRSLNLCVKNLRVVALSSVAVSYGSPGQTSYVMANSSLEALIRHCRSDSSIASAVSVRLGLVEGTEMALHADEAHRMFVLSKHEAASLVVACIASSSTYRWPPVVMAAHEAPSKTRNSAAALTQGSDVSRSLSSLTSAATMGNADAQAWKPHYATARAAEDEVQIAVLSAMTECCGVSKEYLFDAFSMTLSEIGVDSMSLSQLSQQLQLLSGVPSLSPASLSSMCVKDIVTTVKENWNQKA